MVGMWYDLLDSPLGPLLLAGDAAGLRRILFSCGGEPASPEPDWRRDPAAAAAVRMQLQEYFAGGRRSFELALVPEGTPFQREVWRALRDVPYGCTVSYGELAAAIGRPRAVRAVGLANGANPLPIVIPCHRVIGADGSLTGYGGGLERKRWLLAHEGTLAEAAQPDLF